MNKQEIERAIAWNEDMLAYAKDSRVTYEDVCGTGDMTEEDREQLYNSMDSDIKMFETVISALTQQLNNGWIPVTERLPDKYGLYIVSVFYSEWICDYGTEDEIYKEPESVVLMAEYRKSMNGNHKWILHETDGEITVNGNEKVINDLDYWNTYIKAWQPLPQPWKGDNYDRSN